MTEQGLQEGNSHSLDLAQGMLAHWTPDSMRAEALYYSTLIDQQQHRLVPAIEKLNQVLKLKPTFAETHLALAAIHLAEEALGIGERT